MPDNVASSTARTHPPEISHVVMLEIHSPVKTPQPKAPIGYRLGTVASRNGGQLFADNHPLH